MQVKNVCALFNRPVTIYLMLLKIRGKLMMVVLRACPAKRKFQKGFLNQT